MAQLLRINFLLIFISVSLHQASQYQNQFSKSEIFSPVNTQNWHVISRGGATIETKNYNSISKQDDNWYIKTNDEDGFALHLSLNNSWGFHPTLVSSIQIVINGTTSYNKHRIYEPYDALDANALIAFSVNDAEYISTYIRLENHYKNRIYPECSHALHTSGVTPLAKGNILERAYNDSVPLMTRKEKVLGGIKDGFEWVDEWGGEYNYGYPFGNRANNTFPLIFTLVNDPYYGNSMITLSNPIWHSMYVDTFCIYSAFEADQGLDVYIAGDAVGEILAISSIGVTYTYDDDDTDGFEPTVAPTDNTRSFTIENAEDITIDPVRVRTTQNDPSTSESEEHRNIVFSFDVALLAVIGVLLCIICIFGCLYCKRVKRGRFVSDDKLIAMMDISEGHQSEEQLEGAVCVNEACIHPQTNSPINKVSDDENGSDDDIYNYEPPRETSNA